MKAARQAWFDRQDDLEIERLFFIDECGTNTKMARTRGRSKRGMRCRADIPHGHWKTTTLVAALTTSGIAAPMILDGAMDGDMIIAYVTQVLLKELDTRKNLQFKIWVSVGKTFDSCLFPF